MSAHPFIGKRKLVLRNSGDVISWLLRQEMNSVTGEVNTPWVERDTESKIAFTSGWAEFTPQATAVYAEQDLVSPVLTRAAGLTLLSKFRCTTDGSFYPLALVTSATPTWNATHVEAGFHRAATAVSLTATYNATAGPIIATFVADGTLYRLGLVADGAAGYKYYIKGGAFTYWTILFRSTSGATASLYAALAGYDAAFGADFARAVQGPISNPLLSDTFAGTFGTADTYGGAWLTAGTWATAAGVVANTPVEGTDLWDAAAAAFTAGGAPGGAGTYAWGKYANNTIANVAEKLEITFVDDDRGAYIYFRVAGGNLTANMTVGQWYGFTLDTFINAGSYNIDIGLVGYNIVSPSLSNTTSANQRTSFRCDSANDDYIRFAGLGAGEVLTIDNPSLKPLPISTLITNQLLTTTDVLAEMVISAYTLGSQVGIMQSDRPFAFKANANAAAGQNVIVLKGLTNAVPDTDTITIKHPITPTTYTIASVSAMAGGVQTITLDANLVEAVSADDWVGVDWASWNGSLHYFDGVGNIKLDEVKAGVYTNRGSTAKAFSADARLIPRKIGSEYRIFYGEALIGTAITTVDAAAMVGTYWGMFSTLAANTITSFNVYDTGAVTNLYSNLDRYSQD